MKTRIRPYFRLLWPTLLCVLGSLAIPRPIQAELFVEGKPSWGFDGRVRLGQFNLLTIPVINSSDRPWQGNPRLEPATAFGGGDLPIVQAGLYIEPFGQRRLQFVVFVPRPAEYSLIWGHRSDERYLIDEPGVASAPAVIQLTDGSPTMSGSAALPRFNDADFPVGAGGLEALGTVHLNYAPTWSDAQARALADWIFAGGVLHVYHQSAGVFPEFRGALTPCNEPSDHFALGNGQVFRHPQSLQSAAPAESPPPTEKFNRYPTWEPTRSTFELLKSMTQPVHNWSLIYLLAVIYLLLLFPGCWLLGRRKGDYRITYTALLGIVILFSAGFRSVGARGYGERTCVHSMSLVKPASGERSVVTQWSSLFITGGAEYQITHALEGTIYSSGQIDERIPGVIFNRPQSLLETDIPSFSSRTFLHTGVLSAPVPPVRIHKHEVGVGNLKTLDIEIRDESLWRDDPLFRGWVIHGTQLFPLTMPANHIMSLASSGMELKSEINSSNWQRQRFRHTGEQQNSVDDLFQQLHGPLIAYDLGITSDQVRDSFRTPENEVRVYLEARMPERFKVAGDQFPSQVGRVLYSYVFQLE